MEFRRVIPLAVVLACTGVGRADGELPRPYVPDIFRKGETILFIGDSLTDGNHGGDMNHYLGHGFAADIAMRYLGYRPELGLHFANRGKGGENSAEVRARWERDAIPYTPDENGYDAPYPGCKDKPRIPDWLNILVGFNDGWSVKRLKPAELEENLRYMVSTARAANPKMKIVLCDLFWMPDVKMDDDKRARQAIVRKLAKELGLFFVPFEKLFYETLLKEHPVRTWWVWDNVHPTYGAHMRMADFWLKSVSDQLTATPVEWPLERLYEAPAVHPTPEHSTNGVTAAFLEGLPWQGKPTRMFCYYGVPKTASGGKVPGMVLVHGGGGSAFHRWVKYWNERGYAAISMDTCGSVSGNTVGNEQRGHYRHAWSGPAGWGDFDHADAPVEDQWMYHAVADVILAHSFLRSLEGVDASRIGLAGVSWGGIITCLVAATDTRFRFAAPVYGAGFFFDDSPNFIRHREKHGEKAIANWRRLWDPSEYLAAVKTPIFWIASSNDKNFALPGLMRSYGLVPGEKALSVRLNMRHAHGAVSEEAPELLPLADHYLKGAPALPALDAPRRQGNGRLVRSSLVNQGNGRLARSVLVVTSDANPDWSARKWTERPAEIRGDAVVAELPEGSLAWYFAVELDGGALVSSPVHGVL